MMARIGSLVAVFVSLTCSVFAQDVRFTVDAPRLVAVGEMFQVEFVLNKRPSDFKAPDLEGFDVIAGPTPGEGQSVVMSGSQVVREEQFTYTYALVANEEGMKTIKPASATVDGKTYITKALPVEVVRERSSGRTQPGARGNGDAQAGTIAKDDILLRLTANKTDVYKGEALLVQVKLYTRANLVGSENVKTPAFNGFWKQEIPRSAPDWDRETFNGKVYETGVIGEYLLFPQKTGVLEIEQMDMTVVAQVEQRPSSTGNPLFDNMFGGIPQTQSVRRKLQTMPLKINVKELPQGAPASFNGAVGEFAVSGSLKNKQLNANSSGTLTVQISGRGNLPLLEAPKPQMPGSFELYTTKTDEKYTATASGVQGYKIFEFPFIARAEGAYDIPGIEFSYFDPREKRYKTVSTENFRLEVLRDVSGRSSGEGSVPVVSGVTKEELKILNSDIHFIRIGDSGFRTKGRFFVGSWGYILALLGMCALFTGLLFYMQKRIRELRDTVRLRNRKANKKARKRLKAAHRYMTAAKESAFYEEMLRALLGYVADKLNIPVADLSKDHIRAQLLSKGAGETDVDELLKLISECEFAQYAPGKGVQMNNIYQSSLDLIGRLDSKL